MEELIKFGANVKKKKKMMRQNFGFWVKCFTGMLDFHSYVLVFPKNGKVKKGKKQKWQWKLVDCTNTEKVIICKKHELPDYQ